MPLLRITNITKEGGLDFSDLKYISEELSNKLSSTQVFENDIVVSQRGTLGQCAIVNNSFPVCNISANLIGIKNIREISAQFVRNYILSPVGILFLERAQSGQVQGKITTSDIASMPIPVVENETELNAVLDNAYLSYKAKHTKADELLSGMDGYVRELLGYSSGETVQKLCWAVQLSSLRGNRLDANAYMPATIHGFTSEVKLMPLKAVANINVNERPKILNRDSLVPYVGLPECSLTEVENVTYRPYSEVQGRSVAILGDILFARIEPSVFNKKYVFADDLKGSEYAFVSTEFYTVRANEDIILQKYLYTMLFSSYVYSQIVGKTTGSSGRRRIDRSMFEEALIPIPSKPIQQQIADEAIRRRMLVRRLKEEANREWETAKEKFKKELLGDKAIN